jgi:hypothetical protein
MSFALDAKRTIASRATGRCVGGPVVDAVGLWYNADFEKCLNLHAKCEDLGSVLIWRGMVSRSKAAIARMVR